MHRGLCKSLARPPGSETAPAAWRGTGRQTGQTVLFPLAFSGRPVELTLKGGTHVAWSPPYDYFADVFFPTLSRMGLDAGCSLVSWGFYPVGCGEVSVKIGGIRPGSKDPPKRFLGGIHLVERGDLIEVSGRAVAANLPKDIADRMARRAVDILGEKGFVSDVTPLRVGGRSTGAGIFLTARYAHALAGFSALGKRGLPAERVALDACRDFFAFHKTGAPVERHLADQLVLPHGDRRGAFRDGRRVRDNASSHERPCDTPVRTCGDRDRR